MKKEYMYATSAWKKDGNICNVHTTKEICGKRIADISFTGTNPFPCYSMKSTYGVVAEWLKENGWTKTETERITRVVDQVDDTTGEVTSHSSRTTETKVVNVMPTPEPQKSIPELLKEGKFVASVKLYRNTMGCGLLEAKCAVERMRDQMEEK